MPINVKKTVGPHEGFFEISGGQDFQDIWKSWVASGAAKNVWASFWSFLTKSGLSPNMFDLPTSYSSGKYASTRTLSLQSKAVYELYENVEILELKIETAWAQAMLQANAAVDKELGAKNQFSHADSFIREELYRSWPAPQLAIRSKDPSAGEIIRRGATYATAETLKKAGQLAVQGAGAVGNAAGGAAAAAISGAAKGAIDKAKKEAAKGLGGIALGGTLIHRLATGKWWWEK